MKKLSVEERARFRAVQHEEMDQWISNDVISVCQGAGIPKQRVTTMRWVHTRKVDENTGETNASSAKWFGNQTRPDLCVSTSLLQGAHASATVADTRETNKLVRLCRQDAHVPIRVSPIPLDDLTFGFGDCGWCVRRDGSSQGGSLIIAADKRILDGFVAMTTLVDWKSYKCKRVVRSSLAGETRAYVATLDVFEFT